MASTGFSLIELQTIANQLTSFGMANRYQAHSENIGKLLQQLSQDEENIDAATGLILVGISNHIAGLNPKIIKNKQWEPLILVHALYNYLKTTDDNKKLGEYKTTLKEMTRKTLKAIVNKDRQLPGISSSPAPLDILRARMSNLTEIYQEEKTTLDIQKSPWFHLLQFTRCINEKCIAAEKNLPIKDETDLRMGQLLFLMIYIENHTTGKPGGVLYRLCKELLNINQSSDIGMNERIRLLETLSIFIKKISDSNDLLQLNCFIDFTGSLTTFIDNLTLLRDKSHANEHLDGFSDTATRAIEYLTPWAARSSLCLRASAGFIALGAPAITATVMNVMFILYQDSVSNTLFRTMASSNAPTFFQEAVNIYSKILNHYARTMGNGAEKAIRLVVGAQVDTWKEMKTFILPEKKEAFERYIDTLLELDDDILSPQRKSCIRRAVGLSPGAFMRTSADLSADWQWVDDIETQKTTPTCKM